MKNLYEFYVDYGRQGEVEGRFFATQEEVDELTGQSICFGEILGRHSDVVIEFEEGDINLVTSDRSFFKKAKELNVDLETGYNPLRYIGD
jgi:hypothetical protein